MVYARRPSLIMLLPEILSGGRSGIGTDRSFLPATAVEFSEQASCAVCDETTGQGRAEPGLDLASRVVLVIQMGLGCFRAFQFGFGLCLFFEF